MEPLLRTMKRVKPMRLIHREIASAELHQTLTAWHLTSIGIGSVVGAGIFVLTGQAAAKYAGPALSISFVLSSVACFLTGLCYAELSAALPVAGSAYAYTYVMIGEFVAWLVGLCLTLEYMFSGAAVAVGWSGAIQEFLREFGTALPPLMSKAPFGIDDDDNFVLSGSICNLPAMMIIAFLATLLSYGVKESARFNNAAVLLKLGVLITFVMYGIYFGFAHNRQFTENILPFIPPNEGRYGKYGITGIFRGAGAIFFAYVGFDCVCAMAAECKNPNRDLPKGLFNTLLTCTILYVLVTVSLCGMMKYDQLNVDSPVIAALFNIQAPRLFRVLVELGTIAGLTSVCLVSIMSQPRLLYAMARDGLLPPKLKEVHPTYKTPFAASVASGVICMCLAGMMPLDFLGDLISFGTLLAFTMVCVAVLVKRRRYPTMPTPFLVPYTPWVPIAGIVVCLVQMFSLPPATIRNCAVWMTIGIVYYFVYSRHHSIGESFATASADYDGSGPVRPEEHRHNHDRDDDVAYGSVVGIEMVKTSPMPSPHHVARSATSPAPTPAERPPSAVSSPPPTATPAPAFASPVETTNRAGQASPSAASDKSLALETSAAPPGTSAEAAATADTKSASPDAAKDASPSHSREA
jgi:APA family basic amino acid/polyamine antiporter